MTKGIKLILDIISGGLIGWVVILLIGAPIKVATIISLLVSVFALLIAIPISNIAGDFCKGVKK